MTGSAVKLGHQWSGDERRRQYDVFVIHRSTSFSGDGMRQFNDRQEGFELEKLRLNPGVAIHIRPSLIGPISWYGEGA